METAVNRGLGLFRLINGLFLLRLDQRYGCPGNWEIIIVQPLSMSPAGGEGL